MACDYPIFVSLAGRLAVVVGGGEVAARKVEKLLSAGARVRVVAPQLGEAIRALKSEIRNPKSEIELVQSPFSPEHLTGAFLVFACTNDAAANAAAAAAARAAGVPVNRADAPADCDFFVPATCERGPLKLVISTGGASPALARAIRQWLEGNVPAEFAALADELAQLRPIVQDRLADEAARRAVWAAACSDESLRLLADAGPAAWRTWFDRLLADREKR